MSVFDFAKCGSDMPPQPVPGGNYCVRPTQMPCLVLPAVCTTIGHTTLKPSVVGYA